MKKIEISAYEIAQRFVGIKEVSGSTANPQILAMLKLDSNWPDDDSVPWCSGFINYVAWLLRLPRSKSLRARSWLSIGKVIKLDDAKAGFDVVIFKRGSGQQPGPDVIDAPGHVGFFAGIDGGNILVLGGNQSDSVSISSYSKNKLLGVRRLC
ncbi:TIGR02594 family protein [Nitrosomonas marina]|uniref:TIGR02594 family protein n=1 Tax=Nitrosomonas marina TaxID=917 RepID=A0A1I0EYN6_9PROT|nr:TIGR02594 family protein [Nitrosomonas marina]SET50660.1 TIGR02594 family protein [Nitrosomonas marina]